MGSASQLSLEVLKKYREKFFSDEKNLLALNICSKSDPVEACVQRKALEENSVHVYSNKIEAEGKPVTHQKSSGRCWIFATLNVIRLPFIKHLNLEEFEFSQAYLFYWDKIEKSNYFLNNVVETARRGEPVDGRLLSFLLKDPTPDGGQWDMIVNLINKYGLMPKRLFPDSYSCESSGKLDAILKSKLREYTKCLRELISKGGSDLDAKNLISEQMENIYRMVGICLGIPDDTFTWVYYDKNKVKNSIGPISPKEFYQVHVKPLFNVDDKVCLVSDPRPTSQFGKAYTVDCLGNMVGGNRCIYNNQPIELLLDVIVKSIKNNEAVWFGCDVSKRFVQNKKGIQDLTIFNYPLVFGTDVGLGLSKAERLIYGESAMTHAMTFTAVDVDDKGKVTKLRVENSWGDEKGDKGYLLMTSKWFEEFTYEVAVDKKHVPQEVLDVFQQDPIVLPAWDPMGALAKCSSCQM